MTKKQANRIIRDRYLTPEEGERLQRIRADEDADRSISPRFEAMIQANEVANLLRRVREAAGLTLADMEERTGMSVPALSRLETGDRDNPTLATLARYADALGMRIRLELVEATTPST